MSEAKRPATWTWDAYLAWEVEQPVKYELVNGEVYAMTGGSRRHDIIANNLRASAHAQLRGKPCRIQGPDLKVRAARNARYPDALIDCSSLTEGEQVAQNPVAVFEVLSRSTAWIDQHFKLRDYAATPSIRTYVLISQDEMRAVVYVRDRDGKLDLENAMLLEGLDAAIEIADLGVVLRFSDIYEGVVFG